MDTNELLQNEFNKAQKELEDFRDQMKSIAEQLNQRMSYLQGRVDMIKHLMEPEPEKKEEPDDQPER